MPTKFSVRKPYTIFVAVAIVLIFGGVSLSKMTPSLFPDIDTPYAMVLTTDPGANAEEIETDITRPVEQQLATLPKMSRITSTSSDNYSLVSLEFTDDVDMDAISVDIRDKLEQIRDQLPENSGTPVVMKINMDMMPVVVAAVSQKGKSSEEVSKLTRDELLTPLEGTEGVASVTSMGMIDDGLKVVLSQEAIDDLNNRVKDAINAQIDDGKGKVQSGINSAKSAQNKIEDGKNAVTDGMDALADQFLKNKKKIIENIAALETAKDAMSKIEEPLANLTALDKEVDALYEKGDEASIQMANMMLQEAGFTTRDQLKAQIKALNNTLSDIKKKLPSSVKSSADIDPVITRLEKALAKIETEENKLTFDKIEKNYADAAAAESSVNATIGQLEQTLKEIEDSRDAALAGGDLDAIITMDNVKAVLEAQNFAMPAGYVTDGKADVLVSVGDKIEDPLEMENLILFDLDIDNIDPIRLRDIAEVIPASVDEDTYARIDGENGVLLSFTKQSTYATANVANNVTDRFRSLEKKHDGLKFTPLMDQGEYITFVISSVLKNMILGGILAILILLFFLRDIRPTIITAISIPVSVVFALALMYFSGVTLNMISLSGLAIGVGMLVDNSIVVIENTYRLRSMGYSITQAAVSGAVQVAGAITASTLTTICVFAPIVFVDGMTRDIFTDLALTVAYSLLASLMIALTLVPAMARGMLIREPKKTILGQNSRFIKKYRYAVAWALLHKKLIVISAVILLLASSGTILARGFEYMPAMSTPQISSTITMPEDATLEDTTRVNDEIMKEVGKVEGVKTVGAMLSSDTLGVMGVSAAEPDVTETTMYIVLEDDMSKQGKTIARLMKKYEKKYGCTVVTSADMDMTTMMGGSDISIDLYSDDLDDLRRSAGRIEDRMNKMDFLDEVSDVGEKSTSEIHVSIDKNLAMTEGLTVAQIYQQIAAKLKENESAITLRTEGSDVDVSLENSSKGYTRKQLEKMTLTVDKKDGTKEKIKLTELAEIEDDASLTEIDHKDQNRSITVTAAVKDGTNITKATDKIRRTIENDKLVTGGVRVDYGGQSEEIMHAMKQLLLMMIVGFILVYLVMVAQFQSIRAPLIIIFSVPLAFTGGMIALLITGNVMSVISMFGMVLLMGIVVNNAIVLVDCINRFRLEGMEMDTAIITAGSIRMRPVLMTAITTILGLIPLALGLVGNGAEMVQPLAIVCIGGLIYATATTLIVIPVMYRIIAKRKMEKIREEELEIVSV